METFKCPGFKAGGVAAGLKANGKKDLGIIYSEDPASVAGVFTRNLVKAAPVLLDQKRIKTGSCRAVVVNSGNANCCTGEQGMQDAVRMARLAAAGVSVAEDDVLVASTGVIGEPLPIQKVETAIPGLITVEQVDNVALAVKLRRELDVAEKAELERATERAWANLPHEYQWLKDWEYV